MDHILQLPSNPAFRHVLVPYITGAVYDNQGFSEFPSRRGWDVQRLHQGDLHGRTPRDVQRFFQSWLWFGTLSEFLNSTLEPLDFVCDDDAVPGGLRLRTTALEKRLARWRTRLSEDDDPGSKAQKIKNILACLETTSQATRSHELAALMGPELHLAVCILGSTLDKARITMKIYPGSDDEGFTARQTKQHDLYFRFGTSKLLEERLSTNGWCTSQIAMMRDELTPVAMYYMSLLRRPPGATDHSACSGQVCGANQMDESTYKTKHARGDCICGHFHVDQRLLAEILEQGNIPLIGIKPGSNGKPIQIRLTDYNLEPESLDKPYIAISHVWKDGLGNVEGNSLPMCQLERLGSLVREVFQRTGMHNSQLQFVAEKLGDGRQSLDDILAELKMASSSHLISERTKSRSEGYSDPRAVDVTTKSDAEASGGAESLEHEGPLTVSDTGSQFHFSIMDSPDVDFMSWHNGSGNFNFDWKAFDLKEMQHVMRDYVGVETGDEIFLWLDTLCIPHEKRLRRMAIERIKHVFANAERVLVLDSELESISGATSYEEVLLRINFSGWMQRAWTLEEAAVGSVLIFQFADGGFNLWQYGRTWFRRANRSIVLADASRPWMQLRQLQQPRHHIQQMQMAHDTLERRVTSKVPDLSIIYSVLMGVNVRTLLGPAQDWPIRARVFSKLKEMFGLGFFWVSDKVEEENYLPVGISSIDRISAGISASKHPEESSEFFENLDWLEKNIGRYREEPGFVIRSPALVVAPYNLTEFPEFFAFHKDQNSCLRVVCEDDGLGNAVKPRRPQDTAVILTPLGLPTETGQHKPGILLSYYMRANLGGSRLTRIGVNFCTFRTRVDISLPSGASDEHIIGQITQVPSIIRAGDRSVSCVLSAEAFREDTMWCME